MSLSLSLFLSLSLSLSLLLGWVGEVRKNGKEIRIVPRVLFEGWSIETYQQLFTSQQERTKLATFLTNELSVIFVIII